MERALLTLLLIAAGAAGAGEVYKWHDADGRVHYTDQPPAQSDATPVPVVTCPDEACRERRERAYRDAIEEYEAMQRDAAAAAGRRTAHPGPPRRPPGVAPGMTRREVVKAWGRPAFIKHRAGKFHGGQLWIYRDGAGTKKVRFNREGVVLDVMD